MACIWRHGHHRSNLALSPLPRSPSGCQLSLPQTNKNQPTTSASCRPPSPPAFAFSQTTRAAPHQPFIASQGLDPRTSSLHPTRMYIHTILRPWAILPPNTMQQGPVSLFTQTRHSSPHTICSRKCLAGDHRTRLAIACTLERPISLRPFLHLALVPERVPFSQRTTDHSVHHHSTSLC